MQNDNSFKSQALSCLIPIFKTETDQPISEWSTENIRLPEGEGAEASNTPDWELSPEIVPILECCKDPEVREIYLMFSAQSTKTLFQFVIMPWWASVMKVNGMFVAPSVTLYKRLKRRIAAVFEISNIGYSAEKSGMDFFKFKNTHINMALASSPDSMAEMPATFVDFDEIDEIKKTEINPIQQARNRLRTKPNSKLILASTPKKLEGEGGILDYYSNSKRFVLEMKCPHCSEWSHFTEEHIMAPEGDDFNKILDDSSGYAVCEKHGCEIYDEDHEEMVVTQKWVCLDPDKSNRFIGFYKPVWNTRFVDWTDVAAERLKTESEGDNSHKDFWNSWCAKPVDLSARIIDLEDEDIKLNKYKRGQIPADVHSLTLGIDLGKAEAWCVILGWASDGKVYEIWDQSISWDDRDFKKIERGIQHLINDIGSSIKFLGKGPCPRIVRGLFDSGYNAGLVYDFCRRNALFYPAKGQEPMSKQWLISKADPQKKYGRAAAGVSLYVIKSYFWQDTLDTMSKVQNDGPKSFNVPHDVHTRYISHMNAEVKKTMIDKYGNKKEIWMKKNKWVKNDMRDATIYGIVAGHIEGLQNISKASGEVLNPKIRTIQTERQNKTIAQTRRMNRGRR